MMIKNNFKTKPIKSTPQRYERWIKALEKELQDWYEICKEGCEYCELIDDFPEGCLLKQILGIESP